MSDILWFSADVDDGLVDLSTDVYYVDVNRGSVDVTADVDEGFV